jgi:hypothetical protein
MKTKTKKPGKKFAPSAQRPKNMLGKRQFAIWSSVLAVAILVVAYQIVRANNDSGLPLTTAPGSLAREAQLDTLEQQQQSHIDAAYVSQQASNAQNDAAGLSGLTEVLDDATH